FIVNSKNAKKTLHTTFGVSENKIETIYNFFDINQIKERAKKPLSESHQDFFTEQTIVAVGRLVKLKGHHHLIKVFADVAVKAPLARLVIVGTGVEQNALIQLTERLGISKKVLFAGFQENPFKYVAKAKILAFSSDFEGFGNVIVEALASGTPVISVDIDNGPREILAPDSVLDFRTDVPERCPFGWLMPQFREGDENKHIFQLWADTLIDLMNQPAPLVEKKVLESRAEDFDLDKISLKFSSLFEKITPSAV
ncbi:MAG TPA: glycosyltransferase, partial [Phaeodactylibacter sp.]|nr:glycosyltransferase [Phaeodactylibacter sp.]